MQTNHKAIPASRDRLQSRLLVWTLAPALAILCVLSWTKLWSLGLPYHVFLLKVALISSGFAILVRSIRSATSTAAICGGLICLLLTANTSVRDQRLVYTSLPALVTLFIFTFLATRIAKRRRPAAHTLEDRKGRSVSQVVANLATAALATFVAWQTLRIDHPQVDLRFVARAMALAALAEATADTVSSELGQAFGGRPFLITTFRRVEAGTDGAISLKGTLAGITAGAVVTLIGVFTLSLDGALPQILTAATAGLFFDSLLGATLERRGFLGNDLVNFSSTLFAAVTAAALLTLFPLP